MRNVILCDICHSQITINQYRLKAKYRFDEKCYYDKLDICEPCWEEMKRYIIKHKRGDIDG